MATGGASQFLFLLCLLISCSYGASINFDEHTDLKREKQQVQAFHLSRKDMQNYVPAWVNPTNHDQLMGDPSPPTTPVTNPVTTPVTNPVTTPPAANFPPAGIVTVPATTPTPSAQTPPNPVPSPLPVPSTNPNPVNTPFPAVTNPVTTPAGGGFPVTPPAAATNAPPVSGGQSWCVARSGVPEITLQSALDYACGIGGADCSGIQQSGSCYNPNSLQNHASFAFNSYYQKNPLPTSCDFGGTAIVTSTNPSKTHTQSSKPHCGLILYVDHNLSGTPPTLLNASNPVPGGEMPGLGDAIPLGNTSTISMSPILQPFVGYIFLVASISTGTLALNI
nr:glucan endo-1,3-beta-glucosidase 4-like [Ipomoea batatas]